MVGLRVGSVACRAGVTQIGGRYRTDIYRAARREELRGEAAGSGSVQRRVADERDTRAPP
jgi:hypothetical protein